MAQKITVPEFENEQNPEIARSIASTAQMFVNQPPHGVGIKVSAL
jgi:hypothetical protein